MKRIGLLLLPVVLITCASTPRAKDSPQDDPSKTVNYQADGRGFDPASITKERHDAAKAEVQALIADLNRIIRARNYNGWLDHLADSYLEEISSQAFLEERTEELYRRDQIVAQNTGRNPNHVQKKILRVPRDYFDNVVVPSRSNDRMDDIDFISENRVKAYTINSHGQRLILYDLEMIANKWKIIN